MWLLVPLTALWVNLHAGFVAWLATLGLLVLFCGAQRDWSGVRRYGTLAALCSLASLLNPYGWQLHLHIARYLNSSWILDHVQEFQSPHIRSEGMIVFALLLLATVALVPQADRFEAAAGAGLGISGAAFGTPRAVLRNCGRARTGVRRRGVLGASGGARGQP